MKLIETKASTESILHEALSLYMAAHPEAQPEDQQAFALVALCRFVDELREEVATLKGLK